MMLLSPGEGALMDDAEVAPQSTSNLSFQLGLIPGTFTTKGP
jgi:hypothetical protein